MFMSVAMVGLNTVSEEKFDKLKASYLKLREEHVQLLREEGDVRKQLTSLQVVVTEENTNKKVTSPLLHLIWYPFLKELEDQIKTLQGELQDARDKMVMCLYIAVMLNWVYC